jgi:hypothetical protein
LTCRHVGDFNAYAQEIPDGASALYRFSPDAAVLTVQSRDIAPLPHSLNQLLPDSERIRSRLGPVAVP